MKYKTVNFRLKANTMTLLQPKQSSVSKKQHRTQLKGRWDSGDFLKR